MIKHLAGKTIFVSGGSRGIGKAIALRCAKDGANIILAAKTAEPHPKLPGTIFTAAKEIEEAGGNCLPCTVDIRYEDQVIKAMEEGSKKFGGIDILVNNASAISLTGTLDTPMKKYDLMNQINARGTYLCSRVALPYLLKSKNPHILNLAPPLSLNPKWFKSNVAYTMAKYGMSLCVLGMSEEFKDEGVAVNALWPRTAIATDAIDLIASAEMRKQSRTVDIMSDAAYLILSKNSKSFTGNFVIDEYFLRQELGLTNFDKYSVAPGNQLMLDFFLDEEDNLKSPTLVAFVDPKVAPKMIQQQTQVQSQSVASKPVDLAPENTASASGGNDVSPAMNSMKTLLSAEMVEKIKGVYAFKITDANPDEWYLDLKNGNGDLAAGQFKSGPVNCTLTMKSEVFNQLASGSLKATNAFMTGKLKIKGDMNLAMKLEKLMGSIKAQPVKPKPAEAVPQPAPAQSAPSTEKTTSSSGGIDVSPAMDSLKRLLSAEMVEKTKGVYSFKITDASPDEWYLDLKNGNGDLAAGQFTAGQVNCTLTMKSDVFNKLVSGSLKPTAAFMTGKLKIKGDMSLAMKLEKLMGSIKSKL